MTGGGRRLLVLTALWLWPAVASAKLGGTVDSVEGDRKFYGANIHRVTNHDNFTVHEVSSAGLTLREYVGANGVIFGVAWQGVTQPDLTAILGDYLGEFQTTLHQTVRSKQLRRRQTHMEGPNIVVEKYGHMRAMGGRAYITAFIPTGAQLADIH